MVLDTDNGLLNMFYLETDMAHHRLKVNVNCKQGFQKEGSVLGCILRISWTFFKVCVYHLNFSMAQT